MPLNTVAAHKSYLAVTALVVGSFAPVFALGTMLATAEPARWTLDLLHWPVDGLETYAAPTTRVLSALTGGFLLGWGVLIWCLRTWVYDAAPEGVRRSVVASLLAWYVLDSTGSVLAGAASNVAFNTVVLLLGVGPLWWRAVAAGKG